jgi:excisionase family DNA binding protein
MTRGRNLYRSDRTPRQDAFDAVMLDAEESAPGTRFSLLTVREASSVARIHPDTLRRWIREARIPAYGRRGTYRVRLEDLLPVVRVHIPEES